MAHQIMPLGKWRKEVSWNDPDVMYAPDGGHINNQITPEEYALQREIETHGQTVIVSETKDPQKIGKIDSRKFVNRLKDIMNDEYQNLDYEQKLQLLATERPSVGGFFNMSASQQLDEMIRQAKQTGQLDNNHNFHHPVAGSTIHAGPNQIMTGFMANMHNLRTGGVTQQQQNLPTQMTSQQKPVIVNQGKDLQRIVPRPTIKADREQLKNLVAQKQKQSQATLARNPYKKGN